ncbi:hypothetical protein NEFER01_0994 [Nematocida sp. LUAm1]|nr:hypothetical protein NEFER02_0907 [Nematocida sp. LUAm2]KAI5177792.1 hypothetical protein NEFER01_0994 [Nematocida sp. LUAm1]
MNKDKSMKVATLVALVLLALMSLSSAVQNPLGMSDANAITPKTDVEQTDVGQTYVRHSDKSTAKVSPLSIQLNESIEKPETQKTLINICYKKLNPWVEILNKDGTSNTQFASDMISWIEDGYIIAIPDDKVLAIKLPMKSPESSNDLTLEEKGLYDIFYDISEITTKSITIKPNPTQDTSFEGFASIELIDSILSKTQGCEQVELNDVLNTNFTEDESQKLIQSINNLKRYSMRKWTSKNVRVKVTGGFTLQGLKLLIPYLAMSIRTNIESLSINIPEKNLPISASEEIPHTFFSFLMRVLTLMYFRLLGLKHNLSISAPEKQEKSSIVRYMLNNEWEEKQSGKDSKTIEFTPVEETQEKKDEKKKIARALLAYLDIDTCYSESSIRLSEDGLCAKIRYTPENYIYIDLSGYSIRCKEAGLIKLRNEKLEDALERIKVIWCKSIHVNSDIPARLAEILTKQTIMEQVVHIHDICWKSTESDAASSTNFKEISTNIARHQSWKVDEPIKVYVTRCSKDILNYILDSIRTRLTQNINIVQVEIENIDLRKINTKKNYFHISLQNLLVTKEIALSRNINGQHLIISLIGLPNIERITKEGDSPIEIHRLLIDEQSFVSLEKSYNSNGKSTEASFKVKKLYVPNGFITADEIADIKWMDVEHMFYEDHSQKYCVIFKKILK